MDLLSPDEHWRYPDRCARCITAQPLHVDVTANEPELVAVASTGGVIAHYRCDRGHRWVCSWARIGIGHLAA